MRHILLITLLFMHVHSCFAQGGMYGAEFGMGETTAGKGGYVTPTFKGYLLGRMSRSFYMGGTFAFQRYSFLDKYNPTGNNLTNGSVLSISQKSSYFFVSPTLDFGIGYRKYLHINTSYGLGLLAGGKQLTNKYEQYLTTPPINTAYDTTTYYTSYNIPSIVTRFTLGLTERIPTFGFFNIVVSEEFSYIPTNLTTHGPNLKANYFAITVGIMHKYPMVVIED